MSDNSKDTKNVENSSIQYSGKVTIKVVRNNKVIRQTTKHNNGSAYFFKILSSCVTGEINNELMPKYIDGVPENKGGSSLAYRPYLTGKRVNSNGEAVLTALIPGTIIIDDVKYLRLYNSVSSSATHLAEVEISEVTVEDDDEPIKKFGDELVDVNSSYIVEWVISFGNTN